MYYGRGITETIRRLLRKVKYYENENKDSSPENRRSSPPDGIEGIYWRPVGLTYLGILKRLRKKYPDAMTQVGDVRRQAALMKKEGVELPHRHKARRFTYFIEKGCRK